MVLLLSWTKYVLQELSYVPLLILMFVQVHAVGLYGPRGAGVAEHLDYDIHKAAGQSADPIPGTVMDRVDIITGMTIVELHASIHLLVIYRHSW
jgi:hypothetical protein